MRKLLIAGLGVAALAFASPVHADVSGIAPFVGHWGGGHSGGITIQSDGTGRWTYADMRTCPPNTGLAGCGVTGTSDFVLTTVASGTATGSVTASSDPTAGGGADVGSPVTIQLTSVSNMSGSGPYLTVSIGKMEGWGFCGATTPPHVCAES